MSVSLPPAAACEAVSENMRRKVKSFCLRKGLLPCRRLLIALSGGADSVSLLHMMKMLQPSFGYTLSAMHINHMIRGEEADHDEDFCRALCAELRIDFHSVSIDIPALAAAEHRGIEDCARRHRYAALEAHADAIGADRIATAHTATDQLETVLMQLIRGSATAGGMSALRERLIRPMLEVTHEEIVAYTAENALSHVEDSSNADDRYTRNYIRHTILPAIKLINPKAEEAFARFAVLRREERDFLDKEALWLLNCPDSSHVDLPIQTQDSALPARLPIFAGLARLQALPSVLRAHAIGQLCEAGGISGLSHAHFEAMEALISKGRSGASLSLPGDLLCRIEQDRFCLLAASDKAADDSSPSTIEPFELRPGENRLPDGSILFSYTEINNSIEKYIKEKQNIYKLFINAAFDFGKIGKVVSVRSRLPGDRILCGSMHRNVKKCFCDRHIPVEKRALQPIICDEDGILWIPALEMLRDGVSADSACSSGRQLRLIYMADRTDDPCTR